MAHYCVIMTVNHVIILHSTGVFVTHLIQCPNEMTKIQTARLEADITNHHANVLLASTWCISRFGRHSNASISDIFSPPQNFFSCSLFDFNRPKNHHFPIETMRHITHNIRQHLCHHQLAASLKKSSLLPTKTQKTHQNWKSSKYQHFTQERPPLATHVFLELFNIN